MIRENLFKFILKSLHRKISSLGFSIVLITSLVMCFSSLFVESSQLDEPSAWNNVSLLYGRRGCDFFCTLRYSVRGFS